MRDDGLQAGERAGGPRNSRLQNRRIKIMKTCHCCKTERSESEFYRDSSKASGLSSHCKPCGRARSKTYRDREDPERRRAYNKEYHIRNAEKAKANSKKWRLENPEKELARDLKDSFGMTLEAWDELMLKQGGVCAICENQCKSGRRLAVDHIHGTNPIIVRGLLCACCNRAVGMLKDSPHLLRRAADYVAESKSC